MPVHTAPTEDLSGEVLLDKLKVIRRLGGGGMGVVYEVEHLLTGHRRALKLIHAKYVNRPHIVERLIREASVAGKLKTPFVAETYDAGTLDDGSAYVLMELLAGRTMLDVIEEYGRVPPARLVGIMTQVCEGVAVAHDAGIIHRDLKPENIYLVEDDPGHEQVKILDFGISKFKKIEAPTKLTADGSILGTPFYMSPEQAAGEEVDGRTDIYAVGVMLYEGLTHRMPFESNSVGALFIKIHAGEYLPLRHHLPHIDPQLAAVIHRAMHRDPAARFQTMNELRRELIPFATGAPQRRAKTLSDGAPAVLPGAAPGRLPPAPRMPSGLGEGQPADRNLDETMAGSDAPPAAPSVARGQVTRPGRVALLVALVLAVVGAGLASRFASNGDDSAEGSGQAPGAVGIDIGEPAVLPETPVADPTSTAAPVEPQTAAAAGSATEEARPTPDAGTVRPARQRTRWRGRGTMQTAAQKAGLDPNPYGGMQ